MTILLYAGTLLLEHAGSKEANSTDMTTALRWAQNLSNVEAKIATLGAEQDEESASLVFDSYTDLTN